MKVFLHAVFAPCLHCPARRRWRSWGGATCRCARGRNALDGAGCALIAAPTCACSRAPVRAPWRSSPTRWAQERVVKGAPYCADALHESVQPLADGNRIVQRQVTRLCRDGEGRTRQEVDYDGRKRVYLRDPVAREAWMLDPERKTARLLAGTRARGPSHRAGQPATERLWRDVRRAHARVGAVVAGPPQSRPGGRATGAPDPPVAPKPWRRRSRWSLWQGILPAGWP